MTGVLDRLVEARLAEAIAEGAFEGLPGAGAPLRLEDDSLVPPEWRLAFHLLRNAGLTPPWIAEGKAIRAAIRSLPGAAGGEPIEALNRRIALHNLRVPGPRWQIAPLRASSPAAGEGRGAARFASTPPV